MAIASLLLSAGLAAWWGWWRGAWLIVPFIALAVRAFLVGRRPRRPGAIGVIELGCLVLVALACLLASL